MIETMAGSRMQDARSPRIQRRKLSDAIAEEIKRWIVTRQMVPGDRLPREKELIDIFRSSRGTVREALKALEFQGLIEIQPGAGGGARVTAVSYDRASQFLRSYFYGQELSWSQIYNLRQMVEPELAAQIVDKIDTDVIGRLEATLDTCRAGLRGEADWQSHRVAELEFHSILTGVCTDPLLSFVCGFVNDLLRDVALYKRVLETSDDAFSCHNVEAHAALLEAFKRRDRAKVHRLMVWHLREARRIASYREQQVEGHFLL